MFTPKQLELFNSKETPFYHYDRELLAKTLDALNQAKPRAYHVHYALKANAQPQLLEMIREAGMGADCVSGNEVRRAIETGFNSESVVFAGVGKSDSEIRYALEQDIFCFNAESMAEIEVIDELARGMGKTARIAIRVNPNVDAHTHRYITTGLEENKFGINPYEFDQLLELLPKLKNIAFTGLHFHIGSQIQDLVPFKNLCLRVNEINRWFGQRGFLPSHINLGGGLGVNYQHPDQYAIVDFKSYFSVFEELLELYPEQEVHFELGRALVAQCGNLISRVLFVKNGINTNFLILDAGMTELMRPALYQAYHKIENLSKTSPSTHLYDVVGPICESSDCFGKGVELPETKRGDLIAIRTAGAYGEVMSNRYNLREQVASIVV